jgi:signal transduction histidine kinase
VTDSDTGEFRLAAGARLFALVALAIPVALSADVISLAALLILAVVWMTGLAFRGVRIVPPLVVVTFEAIAVGVTLGAASDFGTPLLGALVVAPLMGGLRSGPRGVVQTIAAEGLALTFTIYRLGDSVSADLAGSLTTWLLAGAGFGFIAAFVRARANEQDSSTPYRDARALISQLLELSGDLQQGLDPVSISQRVVNDAREEIPFVGAVLYVIGSDGLTPLVNSAEHAGLDTKDRENLVRTVWDTALPQATGREIAFPLSTDAGVVAVVAAGLPAGLAPDLVQVDRELERLTKRFRPEALQLDTALLFSRVREEATADERRRLAREVHDGVAQDVASLGYLVDDLEDTASTPEQVEVFQRLRHEITGVVAELRRSVFSLRNESGLSGSLGEGIGALARHVMTVSGVPVHLELEEESTRLRSEVESELLRIAQEAMNNAVRHGHPDNIWVRCEVRPPFAEIVVRDDGRGLGALRHDSHGLRIMHERAALVGGKLTIGNAPTGGTVVQVRVGD